MRSDDITGRTTASFEEIALNNMVLVEAMLELLVEKHVLAKDEVMAKVQRIKKELNITRSPLQ